MPLANLTTRVPEMARQAFFGLLGGFVSLTLCRIGWGMATPGDYFGNGSRWVSVSLMVCAAAGLVIGSVWKSRAFRITISALAIAMVLFWTLARADWWVKPPLP